LEKELFDDPVQNLKKASAISRGDMPASRRFTVTPSDVVLKTLHA
jgi:hypothetical protein